MFTTTEKIRHSAVTAHIQRDGSFVNYLLAPNLQRFWHSGCLRQSNPFLDDPRHFFHHLPTEKDFVNITHVQHIDDAAQIGLSAIPPRIMGVNHEVVFCRFSHVPTIPPTPCDRPSRKRRPPLDYQTWLCSIFLDLPNRDWIDCLEMHHQFGRECKGTSRTVKVVNSLGSKSHG